MKTRLLLIVIAMLLLCSIFAARFMILTSVASSPQPLYEVATAGRSSTATVSGTIRHNGNPVPDVAVTAWWEGGEWGDVTGPDGVYSVAGVPTGGRVVILVRPPVELRLAYRNWRTEALSGDLVKDFDLKSGYRLQGELRLPDGTPYPQRLALGARALDFSPPQGEWLEVMAGEDSRFDVILPPSFYRLVMEPGPSRRYTVPSTTVDLRSGDVEEMTITMQFGSPFPTTPPDATKITVSDPDIEGYATVTGAGGAVEPLSDVIIINLSASTVVTAAGDADGAFDATLYAPPGSSLLVKYETEGDRVERFWQEALSDMAALAVENLNPLPGTILTVGAPGPGNGEEQPFQTVGAFVGSVGAKAWAGWWMTGTLQVPPGGDPPGLTVQQGQPVTLTAKVRVTSPAINCTGTPTYEVSAHRIGLRYLFDAEGGSDPWGIWFNAHLFTPTGLPIEHEAGGELRTTNDPVALTSLTCVSTHAFEGVLETTIVVPGDLPDGIYRPEALLLGSVPQGEDVPVAEVWYINPEEVLDLPSIKVGSPAGPRIPWTLLGDYPVNGHRGAQAREDAGRFAMPTRVVFPPHRVVIPRLDERTGDALAYRLEPESHWLSATERRLPPPPHIPLALPSGELTVEVLKPDGTVDQLGPAPILQSSVRTPTVPGGTDLDESTGHIGDLYRLTTLDDAFSYTFDQYGHHVIRLFGEVFDTYGNPYAIEGTYDVTVARVLDLDPAQLPTTPYERGDHFAPGLHLFPPVPADVTVRLLHMPYSDPSQAITTTITGQANRFGYFQPPTGTEIRLTAPGEFRVDISAVYTATDSVMWAGTMTWGNVVEGPAARTEAHGRRGLDYKSDTIDDMPAWFEVNNLPPEKLEGQSEVYYPYFSGDIHWGNEDRDLGDSIHTIITIKDLTGPSETFYNVLRDHFPRARNCFRWPPEGCTPTGLNKRIAVGEAPLFITTRSGIDPAVEPEDIDLWGYWYGSSERPDVRVRELLSEDGMGTAYWRFDDTYGYQIGEPADGDHPGDLKWEFGGVVLRTITDTNPINEYAIYCSLWVLLPHNDPVGARITPPFQDATGAGINGGPIMTLLAEEIDMLFLPKGVRPGDVLEVGDVVAFSGHVGPPLDSRVSVTITSPIENDVYTRSLRANKIGWVYAPSFDFIADEPGRWTVDVFVEHDRPYLPTGVTPASHNTGTVLGTTGRYEFYVVEPGSHRLFVSSPQPCFISWPNWEIEPIHIRGVAPAGTSAIRYTIHDKGVVMGQGSTVPEASGAFTITYDAEALHQLFSMLSLTAHEGRWEGLADEVAINLLAVGGPEPRGNTVTLIGEEVFVQSGEEPGQVYPVYLPLVMKK